MSTNNKIPFYGVFYDKEGNKHDLSAMMGRGIVNLTKINTIGRTDTYRIDYTDGTMSIFDVTNGQDGVVVYDAGRPDTNFGVGLSMNCGGVI